MGPVGVDALSWSAARAAGASVVVAEVAEAVEAFLFFFLDLYEAEVDSLV